MDTNREILVSIVESSEDQVFALDLQGRYLMFNEAHRKMVLMCYGQEINPESDVADSVFFPFLSQNQDPGWEALKSGEGATLTVEFGLSERQTCWLQSKVSPIYSEGKLIGVSIIARDITENKRLEGDLLAAKEAAQADARAKSAFLSSMSHEIRTPMNAILGLTELLLSKKLDDNTVENLKAIRFSANNLLTIINDILDFSKIEAGKLSFDIQAFDLFHVLEEMNKSIKVAAQSKNLVYEIHISGTIPRYLKGDSVRLSQILLNLLGNSLKFTQTGRIRLSVEVVADADTNLVLEFKVADTGVGIPREHLQNIFQSFTQVHKNQRFKSQGTGLGLSITKRLVEMQEGQISVESEVGKGSVFTFRIPYLKASPKDLQLAIEQEEVPGLSKFSHLKVLLVEDNKINQLLAKQILTGWGVNVEVANDGFEAIAKLQRRTFDLILLDLQMPEIDGFEVARFVRKTIKPPANQIPIVALTADAFIETKALTQDAGMNDFITKPYQQKDLLRVLRKFSMPDSEQIDWRDGPLEEIEIPTKAIDFEFVKDKFGKDPETFRYILEVFVEEIGQEIETVRGFFSSGHINQATKPVHKLVSTFTAMGMPDTAFTLSLLERMLKQGDELMALVSKWDEVERDYYQARNQVLPVLAGLPS